MVTINGLFDKRSDARDAAEALEAEGISRENISVISPPSGEDHDPSGTMVGALMGSAGGLLAGLASMTILAIGPALGVGWLASSVAAAAAGGATGGLIGSMVDAGVDEDDAAVYAEGVKRGSTLLSAIVSERELAPVKEILIHNGCADISLRRKEYKLGRGEGAVAEDVATDTPAPGPSVN
jgi:hypothetical protein